MIPEVQTATYVRDYVIHLVFHDGTAGDIDLVDELYGEVFQPLLDLALFKQFRVHPELKTLTWPNGADFAPEFLYETIRVPA